MFSKFTAIWGQKWLKPLEDERAYNYALAEWSEILNELADSQILSAISKCKRLCAFPPSISEFLEAALDIPSFGYAQDKKNRETNEFCKALWKRVDSFTYGQMSISDSKSYLKDHYDSLRQEWLE